MTILQGYHQGPQLQPAAQLNLKAVQMNVGSQTSRAHDNQLCVILTTQALNNDTNTSILTTARFSTVNHLDSLFI